MLEGDIRDAASRLAKSDTPRLDARVLAKYALGLDDTGLVVESRRALTADEAARFEALVARRAAGEPVAYIVGEKEFRGLTFRMAPGVLVPRPDSETLIEAAARRRRQHAPLRILDLGVGSGALLVALLAHFEKATGVGADVDAAALALARDNADRLGVGARARIVESDWGEGVEGPFDLIVSNPPYIPEGARAGLPADVRDFESPRALFAGEDGLAAYRAILNAAPRLAAPGALIVLELGERQDAAVGALAREAFAAASIAVEPDLEGRPRAFVIDLAGQKNI